MKPNKGNKKKNIMGLVSILLWALTFMLVFQSCSGDSAAANEVLVDYSTFKEWVEQDKVEVTDDCSAVEYLGMTVKLVEGDERNLKVTTPMDLKIAEMLLEEME